MTADTMSSEELAVLVARIADDKKGTGTVVLDVQRVLGICDVFVVTSAPNTRLVRTIAEEVEEQVKQAGGPSPIQVEGQRDLQWVLLDYGNVVVHVFHDEARAFYEIERLYRDAPRIAWEASESGAAVPEP